MKQDYMILALEEVERSGELTLDELKTNLNLSDDQVGELRRQIHAGMIFFQTSTNYLNYFESVKLTLSIDDKFKLLRYRELSEARLSSLRAESHARWAIWISIVSFVFSMIFSIVQTVSDVSIPEKIEKAFLEMQLDLRRVAIETNENNDQLAKIKNEIQKIKSVSVSNLKEK